eukprot:TRINITY_DN11434_c0_g1_i2.p2 TRINITY_DN11434_c0_g1~~TRINITY_DN11434_c0_g1_i2.p2  ORF type:complete len:396 (+),score=86.36 TRINITY_DN11434_c0_g1_i2:1499-2686(+)
MTTYDVNESMLMDDKATPFRRAWCTLENFVTTTYGRDPERKKRRQLLEIGAIIPKDSQFTGDSETGWKPIDPRPALLTEDEEGNPGEAVEGEQGWFPKHVAESAVCVDIVQAQVSHENDKRNILRLISGIQDPNAEPPEMHKSYIDVNASITSVFAPQVLLSAAITGHTAQMKMVINDRLCNVDVWHEDGGTPAYVAAGHGHVEALEFLIGAKADINLDDVNGFTPLSVAVQQSQLETLRVLLDAGADVDADDEHGMGPLSWAAQTSTEALQMLLDAGADLHAADNEGETALHVAAEDHPEALQILIEADADVNVRSSDGQTALDVALAWPSDECVALLRRAGGKQGAGSSANSTAARLSTRRSTHKRASALPGALARTLPCKRSSLMELPSLPE